MRVVTPKIPHIDTNGQRLERAPSYAKKHLTKSAVTAEAIIGGDILIAFEWFC
jgi:hypothetical protein